MKITITQEFDTADDALVFLARVQGPSPVPGQPPNVVFTPVAIRPEDPALASTSPKTRKSRSDAGQIRGAYKPRGDAGGSPAGALTGLGAQAPAEPTTNAKPEGAGAPAGNALERGEPTGKADSIPATSAVAPSAAPSGAASLTLEAVRETLGVLHKAPGKGTTACIAALQKFGVNRISDLPPVKYGDFAIYVQSQLPGQA